MRTPDAVLRQVWKIKDASFENAGRDVGRFVAQLRERSVLLRMGLDLKDLHPPVQKPFSKFGQPQPQTQK